MSRRVAVLIACLWLAPNAGCSSRSAAATQSTPKAFDPAASDPKALALVDEVVKACGGEQAWAKAKEISWTYIVAIDGEARDVVSHSWDRWNGRHRYRRFAEDLNFNTAMYDIYERTGVGMDGNGQELTTGDERKLMEEATARLWNDSYFLALPFKLKDPGVHVKYKEERGEEGDTAPRWDVIRVTFDAGVGPDPTAVYELSINKQTKLIDVIDKLKTKDGKEMVIGYRIDKWEDVAGLKVPVTLTNLGFKDSPKTALKLPAMWEEKARQEDAPVPHVPPVDVANPGEVILYLGVQADGEPDDERYIPQVTGGAGPGGDQG